MSAHTPLEVCPCRKRGVLSPAWSRTSVITGRRPKTAVKESGAERDGADNIISDASTTPRFGTLRGFIPRKVTGRTILSWRRAQLQVWGR